MEFVIVDRNERQWIALLDSDTGANIPAKYNNFFVRKKTLTKEFNGKVLKRDEWVIILESLDELVKLREIAPNRCFSIGDLWDHPAIIL